MPLLLTAVVMLAAYLLGGSLPALALGLIVGLGGLYWHFSRQMQNLRAEMARLREALAERSPAAPLAVREKADKVGPEEEIELDIELDDAPLAPSPQPAQALSSEQPQSTPAPVAVTPPRIDPWTGKRIPEGGASPAGRSTVAQSTATPSATSPSANPPTLFETLLNRVRGYLGEANLFVQLGLLVLFFGVAFLLKYAAEHSNLPLEARFLGTALAGLALMGGGWHLRLRKPVYALLLQGGGIGITYITVFAAYQLQGLIPATPAFALLAALSVGTALLAVVQDSRHLALFGTLGGFLAPLLASTGSGNYVGLFSYYLVLDLAVLAIAWHKAWRPLNLVGFGFTFGLFALWVLNGYEPPMIWSATAFLLLFFLVYSLIGVLYALRQPLALKGVVDGSLVFGTPLIAFGLLALLVHSRDYGIALGATGFGLYYLALAGLLWARAGDGLRLLAESMLAIGVVFLTLAIPYALDGHWTTATWALEASAILWVAIKQGRLYSQYFALALQLAAGVLFLARNADDLGTQAWLNPAFMGGLFVALGGMISAWQLYRLQRKCPQAPAGRGQLPFFIWGMLWWIGSSLLQIDRYFEEEVIALLLLFTLTAAPLVYLSRVRGWCWRPAEGCASLLAPLLALVGGYALLSNGHALLMPDALFWGAAMAVAYAILARLEGGLLPPSLLPWLYLTWLLTVTGLLSVELYWRLDHWGQALVLPLGTGWSQAIILVLPWLVMVAVHRYKWGALARLGSALRDKILASLGLVAALWSLVVNLGSAADASPLAFMPVANPVELLQLLYLLLGVRLVADYEGSTELRRGLVSALAGLAFVWINAVMLRALHQWLAIPYHLEEMAHDIRVQIGLSILWTLLGCLAMLVASRRQWRSAWVAGGALVAVVLVKMLVIDLGASGTLERIVSFLVVGAVLVGMGYFSPIPERAGEGGGARRAQASEPGTGG
ncbi:DUF2339 domain-containing protein [Aestuariirhabdus litorea]|nr:DUF2339 domain-containing protein [Aestuariirhabdus litorea]